MGVRKMKRDMKEAVEKEQEVKDGSSSQREGMRRGDDGNRVWREEGMGRGDEQEEEEGEMR